MPKIKYTENVEEVLPLSLFLYIQFFPSSTVISLSLQNPAFTNPFTKLEAKFCLAESK